jgi:hypothetical protein
MENKLIKIPNSLVVNDPTSCQQKHHHSESMQHIKRLVIKTSQY